MIDKDNLDVVAWVRTPPAGGSPVVIAVNMSAQPRTITVDLTGTGIKATTAQTLAASDPSLRSVSTLKSVALLRLLPG